MFFSRKKQEKDFFLNFNVFKHLQAFFIIFLNKFIKKNALFQKNSALRAEKIKRIFFMINAFNGKSERIFFNFKVFKPKKGFFLPRFNGAGDTTFSFFLNSRFSIDLFSTLSNFFRVSLRKNKKIQLFSHIFRLQNRTFQNI